MLFFLSNKYTKINWNDQDDKEYIFLDSLLSMDNYKYILSHHANNPTFLKILIFDGNKFA